MAQELPAHISLDAEPWQPHRQSAVMAMGLKRLEESEWLLREGVALAAYRDNKRRQTEVLGPCAWQLLPEAVAAAEELAELIEARLQLAAAGRGAERLYACSLAVAEDLCLLQPADEGYRLTGAHLCAPSHWRLEDKIGRAMDPIHAPVPGYSPALARSVNRFLDKLAPGQLVQRFNWSLDAVPQLCQRPAEGLAPGVRVLRYYRVERQTLRRLPRSGAIVFGILVRQWPLWHLARFDGARAALEAAVQALPPALARYKGLDGGAQLDWSS